MLVQVVSGHVVTGPDSRYEIGDSFHVPEECARRLESLKVVKIIGTPAQEEQPVIPILESVVTTEQPAGPVEVEPVEKPKKKRGRKKR